MNTRGWAKRMIPVSLARVGSNLRAQRELKRMPLIPCNTGALGRIEKHALSQLFENKTYDDEWRGLRSELALLSITDRAGGVNLGDRRAIYYLVRHLRPTLVLEIGTHVGASTVHICAALRTLTHLRQILSPTLVTVDIADVNDVRSEPWARLGSRYSPRQMTARLGCDHLVSFVTDTAINYMTTSQVKYDLIFLDGDHAPSAVYREIPAALSALRPGGFILLHDYFPNLKPLWSDGVVIPGPYLATRRHAGEEGNMQILPVGQLPWSTKLNSKTTSLALLVRGSQ